MKVAGKFAQTSGRKRLVGPQIISVLRQRRGCSARAELASSFSANAATVLA